MLGWIEYLLTITTTFREDYKRPEGKEHPCHDSKAFHDSPSVKNFLLSTQTYDSCRVGRNHPLCNAHLMPQNGGNSEMEGNGRNVFFNLQKLNALEDAFPVRVA